MGQLAFSSASSRSRSNQHTGPRPQHDDVAGHDPLVGQLTNKFLAGNGNLSPAVLVGLHRQLGSPNAVRAAVEAHKNGQPLPTHASPTARFTTHEGGHAAGHEGHSLAATIDHVLHNIHVGHDIEHLAGPIIENLAHGAEQVGDAMGTLAEGRAHPGALKLVEGALKGERTVAGAATSKIGQIANTVAETGIGKTVARGFEGLGRVSGVINGATAAYAAYEGYNNAETHTEAGKLMTGGLDGAVSLAIGSNPATAVLDAGLNLVGLGCISPSKTLKGVAHTAAAVYEGLKEHDESALARLHEKAMRGDLGTFFKIGSHIGDKLSDGIVNTLCPPRRE